MFFLFFAAHVIVLTPSHHKTAIASILTLWWIIYRSNFLTYWRQNVTFAMISLMRNLNYLFSVATLPRPLRRVDIAPCHADRAKVNLSVNNLCQLLCTKLLLWLPATNKLTSYLDCNWFLVSNITVMYLKMFPIGFECT